MVNFAQRDAETAPLALVKPKPAPEIDLTICAHCGNPFLVPPGKGARYCNPSSHRQAAYNARRATSVVALALDLSMSHDEAADLLDTLGLTRLSGHPHSRSLAYHERTRQWNK